MIFSGDSIEYLEMANQLNRGSFPKSNMWMPLYPIMIWLTSKLFFVDLMVGAKLYHLFISSFLVLAYNKMFVQKQTNNTIDRIILNAPIFAFLIFLEQSITLMAEFQFLIITLTFFYYIGNILIKQKPNDVYRAAFLVILSILTKYNGFVNFAVLVLVLIYVFPIKRAIGLLMISTLFLVIVYGSWLKYKPGGDFLIGAVEVLEVDYWQTYIEITKDYCLSTSKYFLPFRLNEIVKSIVPEIIMTFLFTLLYLAASIYVFFSFLKRRMTLNKFLIAFTIIYSALFILRSLPLGKNETNTRTLFYVLFIGTYLLSIYAIKTKSLTKKTIILILPLLSFMKVVNTLPLIYINGIGPLANKEYNVNSLTIKTMLAIKDSLALQANQIYSNEHKILSLFCDYNKVAQLPKSRQFAGNYYNDNQEAFDYESGKLLQTMEKSSKWMLVYVELSEDHPRFDKKLKSFIIDSSLILRAKFSIRQVGKTIFIWSKRN
jgi:hypothetical protein